MARLRARTVFSDQGLTVTAIESLEFRVDGMNYGRFVTGVLRPIAVIVSESDRTYALAMDGRPVGMDQLNLPADLALG